MPEICMQCGGKKPLLRCCYNCAFYYEEKAANYAECLNKEVEKLPEGIAQKYMEETEPCPFYEEADIPGVCEKCLDENSRVIEPHFFEDALGVKE